MLQQPPLSNQRLHYLDAARALALILGIVFHASLSFMPIFIGWAVMDISTSKAISFFVLISHSFRMELFFVMAGIFSHMTLHLRGTQAFLSSRLIRIAVPFMLFWFLLRPLLVSGWIMGAESMRGEVDILAGLKLGFASLAEIPAGLFVGTHLWFLYYLLLITLSIMLVRGVIGLSPALYKSITDKSDGVIKWLCNGPMAIPFLVLPTALCLWFMKSWGLDTADKSLIPDIPVSMIYGGGFLFGWMLHRQPLLIDKLVEISADKIITCVGAVIATSLLSSYEMQYSHSQYSLIKICYVVTYAMMMWSLILLTIGTCKKLVKGENKTIRYIADASYWLYLIHLPIVIFLQITFAELPLHWSLKLLSICGLTLAISLLLYDFAVRNTLLGKVLNGTRKSPLLFRVRT